MLYTERDIENSMSKIETINFHQVYIINIVYNCKYYKYVFDLSNLIIININNSSKNDKNNLYIRNTVY